MWSITRGSFPVPTAYDNDFIQIRFIDIFYERT